MADLAGIILDKEINDQDWKAQKQAERENTVAMRDAAATEITSKPELYAKYLDMQGDNLTYSAGNVALVMAQAPDATIFGTPDRWAKLGRSVSLDEKDNPIKIFVRSNYGKSYNIGNAYDISQTRGRDLHPRMLADGTPEMETALKTLINHAVVPVEAKPELTQPAYYDDAALKLYINPDTPDSAAFATIATEIALCRFHAKGAYDYDRAENLLDAQSISYVMCKRFGIPTEKPDLSNLGALYRGYTPDDRWHALSRIQEMGKKISGAIENGIAPQQKSRANNIQRRNQRPPARSTAR